MSPVVLVHVVAYGKGLWMNRRHRWEITAGFGLFLTLAAVVQGVLYLRAENERLAAAMSLNDRRQVPLLARGMTSVRTRDAYRRTPLVWAAVFGDHALVKDMVAKGAEVNGQAKGSMTALMWAASGGHAEIVQVLLEAGADPNLRDDRGRTALSWSADRLRTRGGERQQKTMALLRQAGGRT